jgi:hypothetical protein
MIPGLLHGQRGSDLGEQGVCRTADKFGVLNARGMANRWTYYIGKDGTVLSIDQAVKPAT